MLDHLAVAFYPEHIEEERWARDIALMKEHGITAVRVLEFAWSRMERADGEFDFAWVHRFMRLLEDAGVGVIACTPTAAQPAWLSHEHPEVRNMNADGHRTHHGYRRNYCPTSRVYRTYCRRIAAQMARELSRYPNLIMWHLDNEFGWNRCHCPECDAAFRLAMKRKYGTLEALNAAWGNAFWSMDYWDWEHVQVPRQGNAANSPESQLASRQFYSDQITSFMTEQVEALRAAGSTLPISTNMMGNFDDIDYWEMARPLDVVGWDNYFDIYTLAGDSLAHHLMRGLKGGRGYWTFENGVNSVGPWLQPAPGYNTIHALSALAHGEVGHTFFRWDSCRGGHEQDLQGLVDWGGRPRAPLAEVKRLRATLDRIGQAELPPLQPEVALVYSWQNYWATGRYYGTYWREVEAYYQALFDLGVACDCVRPGDDLSRYKLALAPGLQLISRDDLERVRDYVRRGGVLMAGRKTFCKTPAGSYYAGDMPALTDVFGLRVAESQDNCDANDITVRGFEDTQPRIRFTLQGEKLPDTKTEGWFEVLEPEGAEALYRYADGYFKGRPAVGRNRFGQGHAFYVGAMVSRESLGALMEQALARAGIAGIVRVPQGAQAVRRGTAWVLTNRTGEERSLTLPAEARNVVSAEAVRVAGAGVTLPPYGWAIVRTGKQGGSNGQRRRAKKR